MGRRPHLRASAILLAWLALALPARPGSATPSIVLITIDTLRADRLGCYGYFRDTTPALDSLAERSILFEHAVTHMGTTLPAHASLLTSTRTLRHGVLSNRHTLPEDLRTLAEMLQSAGYRTAGFVSAAPLKAVTGVAAGFEQFSEPSARERRADETTGEVLAWLERLPGGPFFLWIHYFDPHAPRSPPEPWDSMFSTDEEQRRYLEAAAFPNWRTARVQQENNRYDGEIRFTDDAIGTLLARLDGLGVLDGAAVVVTADHGESLGQHGNPGHHALHAEVLRVPLLLKLPGARRGDARRHAEPVGHIDVVPTLADELGIPLTDADRAQLEGWNVLRRGSRADVLSERVQGRGSPIYALTTERWRYYHFAAEAHRLFDFAADPMELRNVIDDHPDVAARMRARIRELTAGAAPPQEKADLPEEHLRQLRALGYID
jgi:arylsulfatase A-like enzyme